MKPRGARKLGVTYASVGLAGTSQRTGNARSSDRQLAGVETPAPLPGCESAVVPGLERGSCSKHSAYRRRRSLPRG